MRKRRSMRGKMERKIMEEKKKVKEKKTRKNRFWTIVKAEDGEIFPLPMNEDEFAYYQKLCEEEKKNSKK